MFLVVLFGLVPEMKSGVWLVGSSFPPGLILGGLLPGSSLQGVVTVAM